MSHYLQFVSIAFHRGQLEHLMRSDVSNPKAVLCVNSQSVREVKPYKGPLGYSLSQLD